jgi:hypothetical protein
MEPIAKSKARVISPGIARILYGGFVVFALYHAFRLSFGESFSMMTIAMIFDPFDQAQPFGQRPLYQRVWLFAHVGIMLVLGCVALAKLI